MKIRLGMVWGELMSHLAVIMWILLMLSIPLNLIATFTILFYGNATIKILLVFYLCFVYLDRDTVHMGGRGSGSKWLRSLKLWHYFRAYFPVDLIKTADLSPDRNYLFAFFPHGIIGAGTFANFGTESPKWKECFPKIRPRLITLVSNFHTPITRELLFGFGYGASSEENIKYLISSSNDPENPVNSDGCTSNATILVVGGAEEALYSKPNYYQIALKKRKGFIRLALSTGTPIVPVFSFGEVDSYEQPPNPPGSFLRRFQEIIKKYTRVSPIFIVGRGKFFRMFPYRKPITTIVGSPIEIKKIENPSQDEIDDVHQKFTEALIELFEAHKHKYVENSENVQLVI